MLERFTKAIKRIAAKPTDTVGVGSTPIHGGYIQTAEKSTDLQGAKRYIKFSEALVNVAIVGAGIRYFLNLISKVTWTAEPADESEEAKKLAEFVKDVMHDMSTPWSRVVRRAAMYRFYGFSVQEWTAKMREDGKVGLKNIAPRAQSTIERWDRDDNGEIVNIYQRSPQDGKELGLPRSKTIYIVDDSLSDSPEGLGLFRHIVPHSERLQRYEQIEGYGIETDLRGIPILRAPLLLLEAMVSENKLSKTDKDAMLQVLKDFISNHIRAPETGLLLDSKTYATQDEKGAPSAVHQWDVELLKGETSALPELGKAIERLTRNIAILLGVEHLLLGTESKGSYALSRDKTNNFFLIVDSTLNEIKEALDKDFLETLWGLNGLPSELMPELKPEPVKFRDIEQITKALADLATAGAVLAPDDLVINEIRDLLGLPRINEGAMERDAMVTPEEPAPDIVPVPEEGEEE